jgi:AcrR family transcriptional regulator
LYYKSGETAEAEMGGVSDSQKTKARIVQAAGQLFAEYGFSGVTARQIASGAGVSLGAIPYHFGSMEALYAEVLRVALSVSEKALPAPDQERLANPDQDLRRAILWIIKDYAAQKVAWPVKLIEREAVDPSALFRSVLKHKYLPEFEWLCSVVSRCTTLPNQHAAVRFGVLTLHLLASTFMTHRRILKEFAPAVVEHVKESERFVDVLAGLTLDAVQRYADGFSKTSSKRKRPAAR